MRETTGVVSAAEIARQLEYCQKIRAHLESAAETAPALGPPLACVETYGCQQNEADSEQLRGYLAAMGFAFTGETAQADLVLLNTCAIRESAEHRVYGNLGALTHTKRENPRQLICLCGCMAQKESTAETIRKSFPYVDLVFGTHALWRFPELLLRRMEEGRRVFETGESAGVIAEGIPLLRQSRVKAWISIMYGCNNFCSYCIVPHVRGRERSRRPEEILREAQELLAEGCREITLLGQNVNSYGKDLEEDYDFARLLAELSALTGDFRLRFMTSHPKDAGERLFSVMAAHPETIAPALHLPFQSGSSRVLRAMNRGYSREHYLGLIETLREKIPAVVLTSDVIVGFPGETQEDFEETLSLIKAVEFDALFTFLFSPRAGTPAASLPDPMPGAQKSQNFQRLLAVQQEISAKKHAAYVGKTLLCLLDGEGEAGELTGRSEGGRLVRLQGDAKLIGTRRPVRITAANTWALFGQLEADADETHRLTGK